MRTSTAHPSSLVPGRPTASGNSAARLPSGGGAAGRHGLGPRRRARVPHHLLRCAGSRVHRTDAKGRWDQACWAPSSSRTARRPGRGRATPSPCPRAPRPPGRHRPPTVGDVVQHERPALLLGQRAQGPDDGDVGFGGRGGDGRGRRPVRCPQLGATPCRTPPARHRESVCRRPDPRFRMRGRGRRTPVRAPVTPWSPRREPSPGIRLAAPGGCSRGWTSCGATSPSCPWSSRAHARLPWRARGVASGPSGPEHARRRR